MASSPWGKNNISTFKSSKMKLPNLSALREYPRWKNVYVDNGIARVTDGQVLMVWPVNCEYKGKWCISIKDWNFLSKYNMNSLEVVLDGDPVGVKLKGDNFEAWAVTQRWEDKEAHQLFSFFETIDFTDKPASIDKWGLSPNVLKAVISIMPKSKEPMHVVRDGQKIIFIGKTFIIAAMGAMMFGNIKESTKSLL